MDYQRCIRTSTGINRTSRTSSKRFFQNTSPDFHIREAKLQLFIFQKQSFKFSYSKNKTPPVHIRKAKPQIVIFEMQNRNCSYPKCKKTNVHIREATSQICGIILGWLGDYRLSFWPLGWPPSFQNGRRRRRMSDASGLRAAILPILQPRDPPGP